MDRELLQTYGKGLIATTGCPSGEVQTWLRLGQYDEARRGGRGVPRHLRRGQLLPRADGPRARASRAGSAHDLLRLAKDLDLPLVATNDLHYTTPGGRAGARGAAVRAVRLDAGRPEPVQVRRRRLLPQVAASEMREVWRELPEACDNTLLIAERCDGQLHRGRGPLHAAVPGARRARPRSPGSSRRSSAACTGATPAASRDDVRKRAEYETEVICSEGLRGLLPGGRRLHQLGQGQRHPGRPGPRLRRRRRCARTRWGSPTSTRSSTA